MTTSSTPDEPSRIERLTPVLIAVLAAVAVGAFALAVTTGGGSSDERISVTGGVNPIERAFPGQGDEVLQQAAVGVDLDAAWSAIITINGIPIPNEQMVSDAAIGLYSFTPGEGKVIERLLPDRNCVTVQMRLLRDATQTSTAEWCFTAA